MKFIMATAYVLMVALFVFHWNGESLSHLLISCLFLAAGFLFLYNFYMGAFRILRRKLKDTDRR